MPGMWQKTMVYLGLKDDDDGYEYDYDELVLEDEEYADTHAEPLERTVRPERYERPERYVPERHARYEPPRHESVSRVERESVSVSPQPRIRALPADEVAPRESSTPTIRAMPASSARVHVVEPHSFNDAQEVGDRLKADQPVIINLQGLGRDLQRRMIDFSSGLTYAVGGTMSRVADQVFLLTPSNVEVSQEEKERLQARGLYRT
ncbi:MAG TPA: cell division protein SepF [Acidimicrobiia bacterium]|jgi:cell division inhibitor SepF